MAEEIKEKSCNKMPNCGPLDTGCGWLVRDEKTDDGWRLLDCSFKSQPPLEPKTTRIVYKKDKKLNDRIWWAELAIGGVPKGYKFYRKTKAGKWENVLAIANTSDKQLVKALFDDMARAERLKAMTEVPFRSKKTKLKQVKEMKVTSLTGRQIYSTYYSCFYVYVSMKFDENKMFGLSINKGEEYLMYHSTMPDDSIKVISNYFYKLSGKHGGIKSFRPAKLDKSDDYLYWGWMKFNDGYKISVAVDDDFKLYNKYKNDLKTINLSYLKRK